MAFIQTQLVEIFQVNCVKFGYYLLGLEYCQTMLLLLKSK
jgi:hypothetical protein